MYRPFIVACVVLGVLLASATTSSAKRATWQLDSGRAVEFTVPFAEFEGGIVEFVYDVKSTRAHLSVAVDSHVLHDDELQFLTDTVMRIVAAEGLYRLGDSGFFIDFKGRYPIWGPYTTLASCGAFVSLFFGERVSMSGNTFTVHGEPTRPPYSWYYDYH